MQFKLSAIIAACVVTAVAVGTTSATSLEARRQQAACSGQATQPCGAITVAGVTRSLPACVLGLSCKNLCTISPGGGVTGNLGVSSHYLYNE